MPETSSNGVPFPSANLVNGVANGTYVTEIPSKTSPLDPVSHANRDRTAVQPSDVSTGDFPDLDAALGIYGDLDVPPSSQIDADQDGSVVLSSVMPGGAQDDASTVGLTDWYGDTVDDEVPDFEDDEEEEEPPPQESSRTGLSNGAVVDAEADESEPGLVKVTPPADVTPPSQAPQATKVAVEAVTPAESQVRAFSFDQSEESTPTDPVGASEREVPQVKTEDYSIRGTRSPLRRVINASTPTVRSDFRPKTSIPAHLSPEDYASECIVAALSSRLNPYALHPEEYGLLRCHISHQQVTNYLHIRNGILRLWTKNPMVSVTAEEAAGCAKDHRWLQVADVAYQWLVRKGYVNFGCVEATRPDGFQNGGLYGMRNPRQTIVVVGAGMAGLGCARQLEGLLAHYADEWTSKGQEIPKVVIVEGRQRIGGRIYSHPLKNQSAAGLPPGKRCTADMGAQIITGFDNGNPLSAIIRGQLGLHHHLLKDNSVLFDVDGSLVDRDRDQHIEKLYNEILERTSVFRHKLRLPQLIEGDKELIELGRDPTGEGGKIISVIEEAAAPLPLPGSGAESTRHELPELDRLLNPLHTEVDGLTGKVHVHEDIPQHPPLPPKRELTPAIRHSPALELKRTASATKHPTLGLIMDEAVRQLQKQQHLTPQDLRLMNWHYANLEYANAANVNELSLAGWDQDTGNEFEGEHAQIVGGYLQVPRGLWQCPYPLDIRTRSPVKEIAYTSGIPSPHSKASVTLEDGSVIEADRVVSTLPLGVLKAGSVAFSPPLPDWKSGPIDRLGFGTLNKVILVYDQPFWDRERDMFGLLRDPTVEGSLDQADYAQRRGRFYLFWNCLQTSGRPMLVALMAGDAAHQTQNSIPKDLIAEVTAALTKVFDPVPVPEPEEVIISRWGKDRFARGSYSYVGARAEPQDYDLMAKSIGNLHFAGEATCGTHPATVHGAYLSGLRAASEVLESLIGPIPIPTPLVAARSQQTLKTPIVSPSLKRKAEIITSTQRQRVIDDDRRRALEAEIQLAIHESLGDRPNKPSKSHANPFLLYQKDHWQICKNRCDESVRQATQNPEAKAGRNEVRAALGQMWRDAPEEEKRPYLQQTDNNKQSNIDSAEKFKDELAGWDRAAGEIRRRMIQGGGGQTLTASKAGQGADENAAAAAAAAKRVKRESSEGGGSAMDVS